MEWAIEREDEGLLLIAISQGEDSVRIPVGSPPQHPLAAAADRGWIQGVELLASACRPWELPKGGDTPLGLAAIQGHANCAAFLARWSDPDEANDAGQNALLRAASRAKADSVRALTAICSHAPDNHGSTPLMAAANVGGLECVEALLPWSDIQAADRNGRSALALACIRGHEAVAMRLLAVDGSVFPGAFSADPAAMARMGHHPELARRIDAKILSESQRRQLEDGVRAAPSRRPPGL